MRIIVRHDLCQGHARCVAMAPDVFALDDEGYILPGHVDVSEDLEKQAWRGVKACPECALTVEGETGRWGASPP